VCEKHYFGNTCSVRCEAAEDCSGNGHCGSDGNCVCQDGGGWLGLYTYSGDDCQKKVNPWLIVFVCGLVAAGVILVVLVSGTCTYWRWRRGQSNYHSDDYDDLRQRTEYEYSVVEMDENYE
jgi:hypothetical protein